MDAWFNLPDEVRFALLAMLGAICGATSNFIAAALAFDRRPISPWLRLAPAELARGLNRRWSDRLPIVGWLFLSREAKMFGPGHWRRPLVVELLMAAAVPLLYHWEVLTHRLSANVTNMGPLFPPSFWLETNYQRAVHAMFACHVLLLTLMVAATLTDISEKLIPDAITVPGTLLGLAASAVYPWSRLPDDFFLTLGPDGFVPLGLDFFKATSPRIGDWPAMLGNAPHISGLLIALACYGLWIVGLMPRHWRTRRGLRMALVILYERFRRGITWLAIVILLAGWLGIATAWWIGGASWIGLVSSLIGMAVGGGMVWIVRVAGTIVLGREAMGFGDVTLMAMIGAFVGWQPCIFIFFLAPLFALAFGVVRLAMKHGGEIYYGPFLCLATAVVVVRWADVWAGWAAQIFEHPWLAPAALAVAMVGLVFLLGVVRVIRERLLPAES